MENTLTLLIKGMVCQRCIYVLGEELPKLGLEITEIRLGMVTAMQTTDFDIEKQTIRAMLKKYGFDLLHSRKEQIIDKIKDIVEKGIQEQAETGVCIKFSVLISNALHKDYDALSAVFSSSEGYTLEKYIISRKIEKVKELLVYTDQTLSDIAYSLGYSSPAHLSNQLKKHTGFTSSYYKEIRRNKKEIMQNPKPKE
jgi:AraC family transcriptional regulator